MNTKHLGSGLFSAFFMLAGASFARAQDAGTAATPPPPPPGANAPVVMAPNQTAQADLSFPYAFRFHTTGIVGDIGGIWAGNFIGGEISYYDARPHAYNWYNPAGVFGGRVHYRNDLWTANVAYRYQFPLPVPGWTETSFNPLEGYVGGSAGVAWLRFRSDDGGAYNGFFGGPGYSDSNKGRFDANLVAGLSWSFTRNVALRVGYRFIWVDRAHLFYDTTRIDSGALEAGLGFRF